MNKQIKTGDFVVPGDFLATAEEFIPGDYAYEEGDKVYSSCSGVVLMDIKEKKVSVLPKTDVPPSLKRGDIVIGRVEEIRGQIASVSVVSLRGREDRQLPSSGEGVIHVSRIRDDYVEEVEREFKPGDIVRAKVLGTSRGSIRLSTMGDSLGVIVAICSRCRTTLEKENSKLKCPRCGNTETRKLVDDYRMGIL